jgi:hypothetical protein
VVAVSGTALFNATAGASPLPAATPVTGEVPASTATDVFAHVSDAATGQVTVFHGTEAYVVVDRALAQALARVAR